MSSHLMKHASQAKLVTLPQRGNHSPGTPKGGVRGSGSAVTH